MSPESKPTADNRSVAAGALSVLCFLYVWVSLTPFRTLTESPTIVTGDAQSNPLNQAVVLVLFGGMIIYALSQDGRQLFLRPRGLLFVLIGWLFLVTMAGDGGATGVRRLLLACLLMGAASAFLLLPRDERHLARILIGCALTVLGLCYAGVVLVPDRSIHQAYDFVEPALAGDWRGLFDHKNNAASSMALLLFIGLYVRSQGYAFAGWAIAVLAGVFLVQSGGKTAMLVLPVTLVLTWMVERGNLFWRAVVVVGVVAGYMALTVGSTIWPGLGQFVGMLGVDATFTGRTDIWELAIDGIRSSPIIGHGYEGFWGNSNLIFGFREESTWAVVAPTAHNSYVEMVLMGGGVGLVLMLVWIMFLPLRDLSRAIDRNGPTPLIRLYVRMWIFGLTLAGMESLFMYPRGTLWFSMMLAVFGLRLEALADRRLPSAVAQRDPVLRPA